MQTICETFENLLSTAGDSGMVICDSRDPFKNAEVSHSIFTQKFKAGGDQYPHLVEMPTFGHSENHVGLQIADVLCSALLFPMACYVYCTGYVHNLHVRPGFAVLKARYGGRLERRL